MNEFSRTRLTLLILTLIPAGLFQARAAAISWTNTIEGAWSAVTNWSSNPVPASVAPVLIPNADTYTVTGNLSPTLVSRIGGSPSGPQARANGGFTLTLA